jgi:branched-chain amino acid transport system ATP-binding protein
VNQLGAAVDIAGLRKHYGDVRAVDGIDLLIAPGEVVALLGPNGAGKTTTLAAAAGLLPVMDGHVELDEQRVENLSAHLRARRGLSFVPADRGLFSQLDVAQNLRLAARPTSAISVDAALTHFPALRPLLARRCGQLSGGEQQMLSIARALVRGPRVLLIDELSLGLAPTIVERIFPVIRRVADTCDVAVIIVEQHVQMALAIADRVYVLDRGAVTMSGTADEMRGRAADLHRSYLGASRDHP